LVDSALQPPFDPERRPLLDAAVDRLLRRQGQAASSELDGQLRVPNAPQNMGGEKGRHAFRPLASRLQPDMRGPLLGKPASHVQRDPQLEYASRLSERPLNAHRAATAKPSRRFEEPPASTSAQLM
jgi:hypothetical protein